jgi:hypothetical protein
MTHDNTSPAHTNGNWRVWVTPGDTLYINNGDQSIAALVDTGISPEENAANARLIAAAPELLELCKDAWHLLVHGTAPNGKPMDEADLIEQLATHIADAEGRE